MLFQTQNPAQYANPYVVKALTALHGLYMNVYAKEEMTEYDEGRDNYNSNPYHYSQTPKYEKIKLLLNKPVQELYDSGENSFDSYMEDTYIITCDKTLVFEEKQKFEIFYDKKSITPVRVMQCFEVKEFANSSNTFTTRHVMLKPFN